MTDVDGEVLRSMVDRDQVWPRMVLTPGLGRATPIKQSRVMISVS